MISLSNSVAFLVLLSLAWSDGASDRGLRAERGEALYQQYCGSCHSLDRNKYGPAHRGVFGRRAGAVPDYPYTDALASAAIVWNAETLDRWLADPQTLVPGTRMRFALDDPRERALIIAYLARLDTEPVPDAPR